MSLMKKMARIIQMDIKRKAEREIEESSASMVNDYKKAAAYKSEQEDLWKKLYENLYNVSNDIHPEIAESIKVCVHNFDLKDQVVNHPSSTYGSMNRWVSAADRFLEERKYVFEKHKDNLETYTREILERWSMNGDVHFALQTWKELNWLINEIDWSKPN